MKQFSKIVGLALGFGILTAVLASIPSRPVAQAAGSAPVTVINTTANPVPTSAQGTTAIAGTVHAQQSGTWNVGITGTPTVGLASGSTVGINGNVTVGNTATSPVLVRDVDNAARHAFVASVGVALSSSALSSFSHIAVVPTGKRLVIEHVTASVFAPSGQVLIARLGDGALPDDELPIPLTPQGPITGRPRLAATLPSRIYANGDDVITVFLDRDTATGGNASGTFFIFGYLIDD